MKNKIIVLLIVLTLFGMIFIILRRPAPFAFGMMPAPKLEQHIISKLSIEKISSIYTPVLLYRWVDKKTYLVGSGSYFIGADEGPQLLTAEHLFSTEVDQIESPIVVRILRPLDQPAMLALDKVIHTGRDMNGWDICICSLSNKEQPLMKNYAPIKAQSRELIATATDITLASGKHLGRVRSLVSGQWHDVIGCSLNEPDRKVRGICINGKFYQGESGSGFVDEEGSIYVLVTVQNETLPSWNQIKKDIIAIYNGRLEGVATLAGPLGIRSK